MAFSDNHAAFWAIAHVVSPFVLMFFGFCGLSTFHFLVLLLCNSFSCVSTWNSRKSIAATWSTTSLNLPSRA